MLNDPYRVQRYRNTQYRVQTQHQCTLNRHTFLLLTYLPLYCAVYRVQARIVETFSPALRSLSDSQPLVNSHQLPSNPIKSHPLPSCMPDDCIHCIPSYRHSGTRPMLTFCLRISCSPLQPAAVCCKCHHHHRILICPSSRHRHPWVP